MNHDDWKALLQKLQRYLRPMQTPVGLKWIATREELTDIPKLRLHEKHFSPCTVVSQAVQFGWTVACTAENIHADYCRCIHGMAEQDDKFHSGEMFRNVWYDNLEASRQHNRAVECIPPNFSALVASPLSSGRIDPDVCVLYLSSAQAFMLLAGWQHRQYEKLGFTFVGESTCSDSWVHTYLTGKPGFAIPSFADRKFGGVGEWEVRVTLTPTDLVRAVDGLEGMHQNGLRYPIASYSLTTDILDGLPPHYMDY